MKPRRNAPKKTPLAAAVAAAAAPADAPVAGQPAATAPAWADDFNFIAQYVREKVAKEDPSVRLVMDRTMQAAFGRLQQALER